MSIPSIATSTPSVSPNTAKPAPTSPANKPAADTKTPAASVIWSNAAQKIQSQSADVDHDGDSH